MLFVRCGSPAARPAAPPRASKRQRGVVGVVAALPLIVQLHSELRVERRAGDCSSVEKQQCGDDRPTLLLSAQEAALSNQRAFVASG